MKITVTKVLPIAISLIVASIQRAALVLVVAVFGVAFLLAAMQILPESSIQPVAFAIGSIVLLAYWMAKVIDASLQAKGSYMELSTSQLSGATTGFSSNSFTVPIKKIATIYIHQDFVDKLFGVSAIVFTQMNSTVSVYGFDHVDAQEFVKKFADLQSKK
ncbi:MAG: hypothetical protein GW762_02220 [Candidatus Pacebacteria bacterium]|nr:hypothetical protein [Candidatus Paceibacterota bacterium]PIR63656.1 MAG: hypothetical protein COU64_03610 [Candidatus Pacebacteria bacterium CG10_big_fil_rev_8_21_14_0_10_40_26]PIZ78759.1 MAG: hypothetical protein COY01_03980 [Candidatus Pacebacteria bacterium CG_4_10_14_0_2_um_filter_40_20]PJA68390.1 MAG: hypothetical protein CO156_05335 [Candidatus Pacebacteria bacterium CG_4_9_14_3_um_filter_40_12]PJC41252.1 MAG: hypothetical protein CO041_05405 [Candidatus Pacebacteria bacterium CG_4_9_